MEVEWKENKNQYSEIIIRSITHIMENEKNENFTWESQVYIEYINKT